MKIRKVYESSVSDQLNKSNPHLNAKKLATKLGKKFFSNLNEFEIISVEESKDVFDISFEFNICFDEIHKETVEAMEKFNEYIGRIGKDQWVFKIDKLRFDGEYHIYDFIDLDVKDINKFLEQLEMEDESNKYNL